MVCKVQGDFMISQVNFIRDDFIVMDIQIIQPALSLHSLLVQSLTPIFLQIYHSPRAISHVNTIGRESLDHFVV